MKQQKTDKDGFAVLETTARTVYSTIDQHRDGKAHPKGYKERGPFFRRNALPVELTDVAKKILSGDK